ncbi:MAG: IS110 family transposase [Anaerolineae bacterium]|nr:MAG: IS110 family transposase [Anaerolineae bacterium]GIV81459.1 MAG: IS110 family transposase [Anaerolineae bacterium]
MYALYVGIDIAAERAMVAWQVTATGEAGTLDIAQQRSDYGRLVRQLRQYARPAQTLVVMEVTGQYWVALADYLYAQGFVVSVINPLQARRFAQLQQQHAKTDVIDAHLLVRYARQLQPAPWTPPPAIYYQLQQRLSYRQDLIEMRTQQRNRLHALTHHPHAEPTIEQRLRHHLDYLDREIKALEAELSALLRQHHPWAEAARRLRTIKGLGLITVAWLLVATQCFAFCQTPEQAAAFAGLVPYPRQSGSSLRAKRGVGRGGHAPLRTALYMATLAAARYNPSAKALYQRLLARHKPNKVARVAVARKLIHIAWAVVIKERDFDPNYPLSCPTTPVST